MSSQWFVLFLFLFFQKATIQLIHYSINLNREAQGSSD